MATYTTQDGIANQKIIVRDNGDNSVTCIPTDEANSDYQAYLASQENN